MNKGGDKNGTCSTFSSFSPHNQNNWHQCKDTEQEEYPQEVQDNGGIQVISSTFKERIGGGTGKKESVRENDPTLGATITFLPVW